MIFKELYKWETLTQFLISYIVLAGVLAYFGSVIVGLDIEDRLPHDGNSTFQNFIVTLLELAGAFYVVWLFRKKIDKASVISLGFKKKVPKQLLEVF